MTCKYSGQKSEVMYCPARKLRPLWLIPHNWVAALPAQHPAQARPLLPRCRRCRRSAASAAQLADPSRLQSGPAASQLSLKGTRKHYLVCVRQYFWGGNIRCMKLWKNLTIRSCFHHVTFFSLVEGFLLISSAFRVAKLGSKLRPLAGERTEDS